MRLLAIVVAAVAALWSGYWLMERHALKTGLAQWVEVARAEGWRADMGDVSVTGYPNRLDMTVATPVLGFPSAGIRWTAPFVQVLRLSYTPGHMILVWPRRQSVELAGHRVDLTSGSARASVSIDIGRDWALERFIGVFDQVGARTDGDLSLVAPQILLAARRTLGEDGETPVPATYDIALDIADAGLGDAAFAMLDPSGTLPRTLGRLHLETTVLFDRALDRAAVTGGLPAVERVDLNAVNLRWGRIDLTLGGQVEFDATGRANGEIDIRLRNWRALFEVIRAQGWIDASRLADIERTLTEMAAQSGPTDSFDATLSVRHGTVSLGTLALGHLPRVP